MRLDEAREAQDHAIAVSAAAGRMEEEALRLLRLGVDLHLLYRIAEESVDFAAMRYHEETQP